MTWLSRLQPTDRLTRPDVDRSLRWHMYSGVFAQSMAVLTGGAFLVAFALELGASNKTIGLLAAIGPFSQLLQIPSILLVDTVRRRKLLVVVAAFFSRAVWLAIAAIPFVLPPPWRVPGMIGVLVVHFGLASVSACGFNSWMRDYLPEDIMGSHLARRMAWAIGVGAALSLAGGFGIDAFKRQVDPDIAGYSILFVTGTVIGLIGLTMLARVPEPRMRPPEKRTGLLDQLSQPFKNERYRSLLFFLVAWNFAVNLAAPFFVVYMLRRLGLSMTWVIGLGVTSQMMNVVFLGVWGRLADRFTNKSALAVSAPLFMISILLWVFTTLPERHMGTIPLVIAIHALSGMSTAGVTLCAGNIALKAAPKGAATAYLATNALVSGMAATAAPILAGVFVDFFANRMLTLELHWVVLGEAARSFDLIPFHLGGLDFLFAISFVLGLYAVHRLAAIREEGDVTEKVVVTELVAEVRKGVNTVATVPGLRYLTAFPFYLLRSAASVVPGPWRNRRSRDEESPPGD